MNKLETLKKIGMAAYQGLWYIAGASMAVGTTAVMGLMVKSLVDEYKEYRETKEMLK